MAKEFFDRIFDDPPGHLDQVREHMAHVGSLHGIDLDTAAKIANELVPKCSEFMDGLTALERDLLGFAMMAVGPRG